MDGEKRTYFWLVVSVCFAAFMATLDSYIVTISLPVIATYFGVGSGEVSWVVLSYVFFLTSTMLIIGKLSDRVGLKRIFILGFCIFIVGSAVCGMAWNIWALVGFRALQGMGAAMMTVPSYALIPRHVPAGIRGWAFGLLSVAAALGLIVGGPAGGMISGYLSWHWIFLINVPVGIPAILVARKVLPADAREPGGRPGHGFDYVGSILSFLSVLSLLVALSLVDAMGWYSLPVIGGFFGSAVLLAAFLVHESRTADPLVDLGLFSVPSFSRASAGTGFAFLVLAGSNFIVPFYLQLLAGLSPQHAGLVLLLYSVSYILVTPFAGRAADRMDPALLCFVGMVSAAGAFAFFAVSLGWGGLLPVTVFLLWLGVSYGLFFSPNNTLVMGAVPQERQGVASGVFSVISRLSIVLGVSIFAVIYSGSSAGLGGPSAGSGKNLLALEHGFRAVYIFGAVFSMVAAVFSASLVKRKNLVKSI